MNLSPAACTPLTPGDLDKVAAEHVNCDPPCAVMRMLTELVSLRVASKALKESPPAAERCEHGHVCDDKDDCPESDCKLVLARMAVGIMMEAADRAPEKARLARFSPEEIALLGAKSEGGVS